MWLVEKLLSLLKYAYNFMFHSFCTPVKAQKKTLFLFVSWTEYISPKNKIKLETAEFDPQMCINVFYFCVGLNNKFSQSR